MKIKGQYKCGHYGKITLMYNNKGAQEWAESLFEENVCPECKYQRELKERERELERALQFNKENDLVELEGTEAQVKYANTLRYQFLRDLDLNEIIEKGQTNIRYSEEEVCEVRNKLNKALDAIINIKSAREWIEKPSTLQFLISYVPKEPNIYEEQVKKEDTIMPENWNNSTAEITISNNNISVKIEKNEKIRHFLKENNFNWEEYRWRREVPEYKSVEDIACYIANVILENGYAVIINSELHNKIINATFEREHLRWIGKHDNKLSILFPYSDDLIQKVKKISGRQWKDSRNLIPLSSYAEVEEFAKTQDFRFTPKAKELIESYKNELNSIEISKIKEAKEKVYKDETKDILNDKGILEDLLDD